MFSPSSSSQSDSQSNTDNSDNHAITGDTVCSTDCQTAMDGSVHFVHNCNGAQVSSGDFVSGSGVTCQQVVAQNAAEDTAAGAVSSDVTPEPTPSLQQGAL